MRNVDAKYVSKKIRVNSLGDLRLNLPPVAQLIASHYMKRCERLGLPCLNFSVDGMMPLSVNHQMERTLMFQKGGGRRPGNRLKQEVHDFRQAVMLSMGHKRTLWAPTGITAAMLFFESPTWLTKKLTVREQDADNRVKPTFDAVEIATMVPDELHWQFHTFKVCSKRTRTTVYLFDLGDVVDYYGCEYGENSQAR